MITNFKLFENNDNEYFNLFLEQLRKIFENTDFKFIYKNINTDGVSEFRIVDSKLYYIDIYGFNNNYYEFLKSFFKEYEPLKKIIGSKWKNPTLLYELLTNFINEKYKKEYEKYKKEKATNKFNI